LNAPLTTLVSGYCITIRSYGQKLLNGPERAGTVWVEDCGAVVPPAVAPLKCSEITLIRCSKIRCRKNHGRFESRRTTHGLAHRTTGACRQAWTRTRVANHHMTEFIDCDRGLVKVLAHVLNQACLDQDVRSLVDLVPANRRVTLGACDGMSRPQAVT